MAIERYKGGERRPINPRVPLDAMHHLLLGPNVGKTNPSEFGMHSLPLRGVRNPAVLHEGDSIRQWPPDTGDVVITQGEPLVVRGFVHVGPDNPERQGREVMIEVASQSGAAQAAALFSVGEVSPETADTLQGLKWRETAFVLTVNGSDDRRTDDPHQRFHASIYPLVVPTVDASVEDLSKYPDGARVTVRGSVGGVDLEAQSLTVQPDPTGEEVLTVSTGALGVYAGGEFPDIRGKVPDIGDQVIGTATVSQRGTLLKRTTTLSLGDDPLFLESPASQRVVARQRERYNALLREGASDTKPATGDLADARRYKEARFLFSELIDVVPPDEKEVLERTVALIPEKYRPVYSDTEERRRVDAFCRITDTQYVKTASMTADEVQVFFAQLATGEHSIAQIRAQEGYAPPMLAMSGIVKESFGDEAVSEFLDNAVIARGARLRTPERNLDVDVAVITGAIKGLFELPVPGATVAIFHAVEHGMVYQDDSDRLTLLEQEKLRELRDVAIEALSRSVIRNPGNITALVKSEREEIGATGVTLQRLRDWQVELNAQHLYVQAEQLEQVIIRTEAGNVVWDKQEEEKREAVARADREGYERGLEEGERTLIVELPSAGESTGKQEVLPTRVPTKVRPQPSTGGWFGSG